MNAVHAIAASCNAKAMIQKNWVHAIAVSCNAKALIQEHSGLCSEAAARSFGKNRWWCLRMSTARSSESGHCMYSRLRPYTMLLCSEAICLSVLSSGRRPLLRASCSEPVSVAAAC